MNDDVTRAFPNAVIAEKSLLSFILAHGSEYAGKAVEEGITEAHFYDPCRASLFGFLLARVESGKPCEIETIIQSLHDLGTLDRLGGVSTLTDLYTYSPSTAHFKSHVKDIKDKWAMRQLLNFCAETEKDVWDSPAEMDETLDSAEKRIMAIREGREIVTVESIREAMNRVISDLEDRMAGGDRVKGLRTGFDELDRMTGGLQPAEMFVIAARPSMGKTAIMMNLVENITVTNKFPGLVFSAEMAQWKLLQRMAYSRAKFDYQGLIDGSTDATKADLAHIRRAMEEILASPLIIDDTPEISIAQIRAKARRQKREKDIQYIAIDYLQLIRSLTKQGNGSREREIAEISSGAKNLAKELGIPVVMLAQLNRGPESRNSGQGDNKARGIPRMSDLRESGSIEQDADQIGLMYRYDYYAEEGEKDSATGKAKMILAKNRNGPTGDIPMTFIPTFARFESGQPYEFPAPGKEPQPSRW